MKITCSGNCGKEANASQEWLDAHGGVYICRQCKSGDTSIQREVRENNNDDINRPLEYTGEENREFIPTYCDTYIYRNINGKTDLQMIEIAYRNMLPTLIEGETGTGKTHVIRYFCYKNKIPYARVNLNGATTPEDLIGQWVPKNGNFEWQDGLLTRFMRHGGIFVVDEINACPSDILFILHSVLDDERRLVLTQKDGEIIKASDQFLLIATMNPDYAGTRELNKALRDRFRVLKYDYEKRIESRLIQNKKLIYFANNLRMMHTKGELTFPVSTRMLIQYEDDEELFNTEIARMFFVNKFPYEEQRAVEESMIASMDNVNQAEIDKLQLSEFDEEK